MTKQNKTIVYIPCGINASERWEAAEYALRAAGITDIRPAPMPSLAYVPRHARQTAPVLLSTMEV